MQYITEPQNEPIPDEVADTQLFVPFLLTHGSTVMTTILHAPFVSSLDASGSYYGDVLTVPGGGFLNTGLVVRPDLAGSDWRYIVPYIPMTDYLVRGGTLNIYLDPAQAVTGIDPNAVVFKGGILQSPTPSTIPASTALDSASWAVFVFPEKYVLPTATSSVLGGVKEGANITIAGDGTASVATGSATVAGVVKSGNGIVATAGVLNLAVATGSQLGGVTTAEGIVNTNGAISLGIATATALGGVKQGANITIAADGTIEGLPAYALPVATDAILGGVKVGANLTIANGVLAGLPAYSLPVATSAILGGVKVGANLSINNGVLAGPAPYVLPTASDSVLGGVKVGAGITNTAGVISVDASSIIGAIPKASNTVFGIIQTGEGLVSTAGVVTVAAATATAIGGVKVGDGLDVAADGTVVAKSRMLARTQVWDFITAPSQEPGSTNAFSHVIKANTLKANGLLTFSFIVNDPTDAANRNADGSYKWGAQNRGVRCTLGTALLIGGWVPDFQNDPNPPVSTARLLAQGFNTPEWIADQNIPMKNAQTFLNYEVTVQLFMDAAGKVKIRVMTMILPNNQNSGTYRDYGFYDMPVLNYTTDLTLDIICDFNLATDKTFIGQHEIDISNV